MAYLLKDYYSTGDDGTANASGNIQQAQTFTASETYTPTQVKVKLACISQDYDSYLDFCDTDGSGKPNNVLETKTIPAASVPSSADWVTLTFSSVGEISNGTKYALVLRKPVYTATVKWSCDASSPSYAGGNREWTNNAGSSWNTDATRDFMFEVYADSAAYVDAAVICTASSAIEAAADVIKPTNAAVTLVATSTIVASASKSQEIHGLQTGDREYMLLGFGNDELWYEDI